MWEINIYLSYVILYIAHVYYINIVIITVVMLYVHTYSYIFLYFFSDYVNFMRITENRKGH